MKLLILTFLIPLALYAAVTLGPEFAITTSAEDTAEEEVTPNLLIDTSNDGIVAVSPMDEKPGVFGARPWTPPNYKEQKNILGYDEGTFQVPAGLEKQVKFWIDVFAKYNTEQGVLHDSRYIDIIYREIDFKKLPGFNEMSPHAQHKARKAEIKKAKKELEDQLHRLAKTTDQSTLSGEDLRIWK